MSADPISTVVDGMSAIEPEASGSEASVPPIPQSVEETGLNESTVANLILKTLYTRGDRTGKRISEILALRFIILDDLLLEMQHQQLVEVRGTRGHGREGYTFALTGSGIERAQEASEMNSYVGPAPVPLDDFNRWVGIQSAQDVQITREMLRAAFGDLVLKPQLIETIGPAVNSGSSIFLHGAPGNGKTAVAERIGRLVSDSVYIPHAVDINGETMLLFDPAHHEPVDEEEETPRHEILRRPNPHDPRFIHVRRPAVAVGGELTLDQLDLQRDRDTKIYHAPFQLKAIHGVLIIDDFGRQRMQPHELLNRWIVPLEKGVDFLSLNTGVKFTVPFDCIPIFSTNLDPMDLVDEAFLRRIQFKIEMEGPSRQEYARILQDVCEARDIEYVSDAVTFLYEKYYDGRGIPPRGCHPRDLVHHIEAMSAFHDEQPRLTREALDLAAESYFLIMAHSEMERAGGETET